KKYVSADDQQGRHRQTPEVWGDEGGDQYQSRQCGEMQGQPGMAHHGHKIEPVGRGRTPGEGRAHLFEDKVSKALIDVDTRAEVTGGPGRFRAVVRMRGTYGGERGVGGGGHARLLRRSIYGRHDHKWVHALKSS